MLPDRYRLRRRLDALPAALGYGLGLLAAAAVLALVWRLPGGWGLTTSLLLGGATAALAFRLGLQPRVSGQDWTPQALPPAAPPRPVEPAAAAAVAGPVAADEPEPSPESAPLLPLVALPGEFWVGSDKALDPAAYDDELPRHRVRVGPFSISSVPVTRGLWRQVMAGAPESWRRRVPSAWRDGDDDLPATRVAWPDALACCNALSQAEGLRPCYYRQAGDDWHWDRDADAYRLPTEAEWEYACRASTETRWHSGDDAAGADAHAWYAGSSGHRLHLVGDEQPNAFCSCRGSASAPGEKRGPLTEAQGHGAKRQPTALMAVGLWRGSSPRICCRCRTAALCVSVVPRRSSPCLCGSVWDIFRAPPVPSPVASAPPRRAFCYARRPNSRRPSIGDMPMQPASTTVLSQALALPAEERAALVDELIRSLERTELDITALWAAEAKDRLAAYRSGELDAIEADEVFADLRGSNR
jgi:putative addiction module component (TIGR02574 family)